MLGCNYICQVSVPVAREVVSPARNSATRVHCVSQSLVICASSGHLPAAEAVFFPIGAGASGKSVAHSDLFVACPHRYVGSFRVLVGSSAAEDGFP